MNDSKRLQKTLWEIQRRFGDHAVTTLAAHPGIHQGITTGFAALDAILNHGGIPRGRISTLVGTPTCGATTLALRLLACAQGSIEACVYLDSEGAFDAGYAALNGVAVDRLLTAQPEDVIQALEITRDLVKSDHASLIVIDWQGETTQLQRADLSEALGQLYDVVKLRTAVLFLLAAPLAMLDEYTQTCLYLERLDWLRSKHQVAGYRARVTVLKDKPHPPGKTAAIEIPLDARVEGGAL